MFGQQKTESKAALAPQVKGFVNYEYWAPIPALLHHGVGEVLDAYLKSGRFAGLTRLSPGQALQR